MSQTPPDRLDPDGLIACPTCDTLHSDAPVRPGEKAVCIRCGTVLLAPRKGAMTQLLMLALTALVLLFAAVFFPFLELNVQGMGQRSSVMDAVLAFSDGIMLPLSVAVAALIVVLPALRFALLAYVFAPMALGWHAPRHATRAFHWAQIMKPWAMAEIFIVGVAVALVKVSGLAQVSLGPAFWAFVALVLIVVLNDTIMCRFTVWQTLEQRRRS